MATQIYSFADSCTNTSQYAARNTAFYNLFADLVSNPPTGFTVSSYSIPTVSSTAYQVFYVIFDWQGAKIKFYTNTGADRFYFDVQTNEGSSILSASSPITIISFSGTYTYTIQLTLTSYSLSSHYLIVRATSDIYTASRAFGIIYLTDKSTGAEDYVFFSDLTSNTGLYTATGITLYLFGSGTEMLNESGQYYLIEAYIMRSISNKYYGKLVDCKLAGVSVTSLPRGNFYSVDGKQYLVITGPHDLLIDVSGAE